jgi:pimeloyl-ACP methyl ester carboxylesterase
MNPLRGLASDAEAIRRYTTTIDGPVVLVGHSYGGALISQAAPTVKDVRALVFRSAFALEPASAVGWRDIPRWYLVSEHDNAIPPDCERFMAQRMNAVTESVDASHVAFIAQPQVASSLILKALASA